MSEKNKYTILVAKFAEPFPATDKYGHKALFGKINELYRCPKCNRFLEWGDSRHRTVRCPNCGFTKPNPEELE